MPNAAIANPNTLVDSLNFQQKVDRALGLIADAWEEYGERLVVANSLGKDSCVVWDLAKRVSPEIPGFIVTTRYKPAATVEFMGLVTAKYPEISVYNYDGPLPPNLHAVDPDLCCELLKVEPTRRAIRELRAECWVTGLRDDGLVKLNPILIWHEREIWQYLSLNNVPVNPLYAEGYRSLGCGPCSQVSTGPNERDGRWIGTSKCGGECGIHTRPLLVERAGGAPLTLLP